MKEFKFITNEVIVKNNKSLKNRGQLEISMEVDRVLLPDIIGLEALPEGTHYHVSISPIINENTNDTIGYQ